MTGRTGGRFAPLAPQGVLAWADAFFEVRGRWPVAGDGPIDGAAGETWAAIDAALSKGNRGLHGGSDLARLLQRRRGVRNRKAPPALSEALILRWARAHQRREGAWPNENSGPVAGAEGEAWANVDQALREGNRDLPGGDTLAKLLARRARATTPTRRR